MDLKFALLLSCVAAIVECQSLFGATHIVLYPQFLENIPNRQSNYDDNRRYPSSSDQYQSNGGFPSNQYKEQQSTIYQKRPLSGQVNPQQLSQKNNIPVQPSVQRRPETVLVPEPDRNYQPNKNQDSQYFGLSANPNQKIVPRPEYFTTNKSPTGQLRPDINQNYPGDPSRYPNIQQGTENFPKETIREPNNQLGNNKYENNRKTPSRIPNNSPEAEIKFEDYQPVTEFSWNFFKNTINDDSNSVVCPLSPQLLLSYIAYGASGNTKREIVNAIRYNGPSQLNTLIRNMLANPGKKELQLATAMFISDRVSMKPTFSRILESNAEIVPTDFTNTEAFNRNYARWVTQKTKGELSSVRAAFQPSTKMVMTSAVYFKGDWIFKLYPAGTGQFTTSQGKSVNADMMSLQRKLPWGKVSDYAEWLGLPYDSNETMIIVMPNKGVKLDDMIARININTLLGSMNHENYGNVTLKMPKFRVESKLSLVNPLQQMGIKQMFTPNAELPNMFDSNEPLAISNFIQQSSLEVNEQGSIATTATSFSVVALSFTPPTPDVEFIVDRPFIAMIVDRYFNFPYFIAKITNPSS